MITKERLHEMFEYRDGSLYRKISLGRTKAGDKVGFVNDKGYLAVNIANQCVALHRIIWMMQYGEMPTLIDHVDGNRQNNKISNLRLADKFGNAQNKRLHKNNKSGIKGVHWVSRISKWQAQIVANKKHYHLGYYKSITEANEIVCKARNKLHKHFANHGIQTLTDRITALENK